MSEVLEARTEQETQHLLIRLVPEDIATLWDSIKYGMERSLPPHITTDEKAMSAIMQALMMGDLVCWALGERLEDGRFIPFVLCTTQITTDPISETKNVLIYTIYGISSPTDEMWTYGLAHLVRYARRVGAHSILWVSTSERVRVVAERYGFNASFTLGILEV